MTDNEAPDRQAEREQQQQHSEQISEMLAQDSVPTLKTAKWGWSMPPKRVGLTVTP